MKCVNYTECWVPLIPDSIVNAQNRALKKKGSWIQTLDMALITCHGRFSINNGSYFVEMVSKTLNVKTVIFTLQIFLSCRWYIGNRTLANNEITVIEMNDGRLSFYQPNNSSKKCLEKSLSHNQWVGNDFNWNLRQGVYLLLHCNIHLFFLTANLNLHDMYLWDQFHAHLILLPRTK